jgi:hypothetical protein
VLRIIIPLSNSTVHILDMGYKIITEIFKDAFKVYILLTMW